VTDWCIKKKEPFMLDRPIIIPTAVLALALLGGCATTRSELQLPPPSAPTGAAPAGVPPLSGKVAVIRSVKDERVFEDAPGDPSTPSLGFGGASQATALIKLRAIGRKRGGFGQAFGDVLLQEGQTVETVIRDNLAAALRQAGIRAVAPGADAPPDALQIDAHIKAFWSWINPGFWAITANGRIHTELDVSARTGTTRIAVEHNESRQLMTETAWLEVAGKTLELYRAEAAKQLGVAAAGP
jgi:hypothetical protein